MAVESPSDLSESKVPAESDTLSPKKRRNSIWRPYLLPVGLALVVISGSLVSAVWIRISENKALENAAGKEIGHLASELGKDLDFAFHPLFQFGWRLSANSVESRRQLSMEAQDWIESSDAIKNLIWLDGQENLVLQVPAERSWERLIEEDEFKEQRVLVMDYLRGQVGARGISLERSNEEQVDLIGLISVLKENGLTTFVVAIYDLKSLLSEVLEGEATGYSISVSDDNAELWSRIGEAGGEENTQFRRLSFVGMEWTIKLTPGPAVIATYRSTLPAVILFGGSALGILLGLSISTAFQNRFRAEKLSSVNTQLLDEARRRTKAEVAEKEARTELEDVLDQLPVHVWSAYVDPGGRMQPLRTTSNQLSDRPVESYTVWPDSWFEMIVPEDRDRVRESISNVAEGKVSEAELEYGLLGEDGRAIYLADTIRARPQGDGLRLAGVSRNVTHLVEAEADKKRMEERLEQAQKLESLGVLAGGIAHDFNNLLVGVLGHARLAAEDLPDDSPVQKSIKSIDRAARRAADLCRQMLAYAGKAPVSIKPIDLRESVEDIGELLRASLPASSIIEYEFDEKLPAVQADGSQIQQVVLNLITNATEALGEGGGRVSLSVSSGQLDERDLAKLQFGESLSSGRYVTLTVKDTGCGMDDETKRRIFEPFFTTKFTGRGLGLAAVIGIVRGHGGGIRIDSQSGEGTSIAVVLPATHLEISEEVSEVEDSTWHGNGQVLIIEDEVFAREVAVLVLQRAGFETLEAEDGVKGLEIFKQHQDGIRCVVLDLAMPNMSGDEAHRHIRELKSETPTILCSGYPEQDAILRFSNLNPSGFIEKPYTPEKLVAKVRAVLKS